MKKPVLLLAALATAAPLPTLAFPGLGKLIPGAASVPGASVNPDRFLADTLETSKFMMVAAALLAQAVTDKQQMASRASYIAAVQNAHDCKELESHSAQFQQDVNAIAANQQSTAEIQVAYDQASAEQKKLISAAMYNLMLGVWRNVKLSSEGADLVSNIKSHPMMLMKAPQLMSAVKLIAMEVKATGSIASSVQKLSTAMKVEAPVQAETTKPKEVALS
jgi:hypothetical protein